MARQGVFNRNDNSLTPVPRSLQYLNHRCVKDMRYGEICPIFCEQMLPNESIRVNVTNFLRTIPMKTPQLSRVKIITRFYAVPNRLTWLPFEEYIDGVKDSRFALTEPYIANMNAISRFQIRYDSPESATAGLRHVPDRKTIWRTKSAAVSGWRAQGNADTEDFSVVGVKVLGYNSAVPVSDPFLSSEFCSRSLVQIDGTAPQYETNSSLVGYQFFPHELGDMFNEPLFTVSLGSDVSGRISAYKYAAYQLCYSYFYRNKNVQTRVDDLYEMQHVYNDTRMPEFPSFYQVANMHDKVFQPPISEILEYQASSGNNSNSVGFVLNPPAVVLTDPVNPLLPVAEPTNMAELEGAELDTSWDNVEHFPLKGGANFCMNALDYSDDGRISLKETRILLTRSRFANWESDRFTMSNPWQQRGDEARIPVFGSVSASLEGVTFTGTPTTLNFTPNGVVTSSLSKITVPTASNRDVKLSLKGATGFNVGLHNPGTAFTVPAAQNYTTGMDFELYNATPDPITVSSGGKVTPWITPAGNAFNVTSDLTSTFEGSESSVTFTPQGSVSGDAHIGVSGLYVSPSMFRFAMQLQKIKEMSARTDGRFKSFLSMFYGARSKDARLDRPEFLGGSVQELDIQSVPQTSETQNTPLGTLGANGISAKKSNVFTYHAHEHTIILGLVHIIPQTVYIGGLDVTHHLTNPFDWPMPQFAGLSEQPIRMAELAFRPTVFETDNNEANDVTWGFEPRYNQKRVKHSYATGAFRDVMNSLGSYNYFKPWLVTRDFGFTRSMQITTYDETQLSKVVAPKGWNYSIPSLSDEFLSMRHTCDYDNFSVTDPQVMYPFMLDSYHTVRWTTVVPTRGIPRL